MIIRIFEISIIILYLFVFFFVGYALFNYFKSKKNINKKIFIISVVTIISIPLFVFLIRTPNKVATGERDIYSYVYYNRKKDGGESKYHMNVTYNISYENGILSNVIYKPKYLHWLSGGYATQTLENASGTSGDIVKFINKDGTEYRVLIPNTKDVEYFDKFINLGIEHILYILLFCMTFYTIYRYKVDKEIEKYYNTTNTN